MKQEDEISMLSRNGRNEFILQLFVIAAISTIVAMIAISGCRKTEADNVDQETISSDWRKTVIDGVEVTANFGDITLSDAAKLPVYPMLIGGSPADPKDWPASFITSQGSSRCTGTMIAPNVLQLAAHCVGNGRMASIKSQGVTYSGTCEHSPKYRNDSTADYALCLMSQPVDLALYEGIIKADEASTIKVGDNLLLAGMGCTQQGGGGASMDGILRVGEAPIIRLPKSSNDIVTEGNAALCFGDSGGSVFWKNPKGVYKIAGINSRGDIRTTSYLSATFTKDAVDFYTSFAAKNQVKICGMADDAVKCRGEETPNPTPVPPWCAATLAKVNLCIFGTPRLALSEVEACRAAYSELFACQAAAEIDESKP